ncbi:MAG TPA: SPOR domain-containing protein [Gammaproteobacteria bacterium]
MRRNIVKYRSSAVGTGWHVRRIPCLFKAVTAGALLSLYGVAAEVRAAETDRFDVAGTMQSPGVKDATSGAGISRGSDEGRGNARSDRASTDVPAASDAAQAEVGGLAWINQQPSGNYTLQVMVAVSSTPLVAFARRNKLAGPLAVATFRRDEKMLYLLLQGSYASRSEAESAALRLEKETGERPWTRRFSALPDLSDSNAPPPRPAESASKPPIRIMGAAWLWSRNPTRYTLQLMADRRADSLRAFVAEQRPDGAVAIVRVKRKGRAWYLLLAGDYPNQEEAAMAISALPRRATTRGPWPRRFASLQDQMVAGNR